MVVCQGMVDEHSACMARGPVGIQDDDGEEQPGYAAAVREWNARAQQTGSGAIQGDYALVPRVATMEMKQAGLQEADRQGVGPESVEMQAIWHAMLAAAPSAAEGEAGLLQVIEELITACDHQAYGAAISKARAVLAARRGRLGARAE